VLGFKVPAVNCEHPAAPQRPKSVFSVEVFCLQLSGGCLPIASGYTGELWEIKADGAVFVNDSTARLGDKMRLLLQTDKR